MSGDEAIKRAAGVIMWDLSKGKSEEYALARAEEREPQLTPADLREALDWAMAGIRLAALLNASDGSHKLCDLMDISGIPLRECDDAEC
jgi:hypothetical protein